MLIQLTFVALQVADPTLQMLFADVPPTPSCSVTLTVKVTETKDGPTNEQVYRYDRLSEDWTYVSLNGGAVPEEEREEFEDGDVEERTLPAAIYAKALGRTHLEWSPVPEEPNLFRADDLPDDEIEMNGKDVSSRVMLDYRVDDTPAGPRLKNASMRLKQPWRIPFVAKIDSFSVTRDFAAAEPETGVPGMMLPTEEVITFVGDITGKMRDSRIVTNYADWDCVGAPDGSAD